MTGSSIETQKSTSPLTLVECASRLKDDLGDQAPALITLKRWSAGKQLNKAKYISKSTTAGVKSRPKYHYDKVLDVALGSRGLSSLPVKQVVLTPAIPKASEASTQATVDMVNPTNLNVNDLSELSDTIISRLKPHLDALVLKALEQSHKDVTNAINNVESVRRTLMLKYDAQVDALRNKCDELVAENRKLKSEVMDANRVSSQLARLNDRIDQANSVLSTGRM